MKCAKCSQNFRRKQMLEADYWWMRRNKMVVRLKTVLQDKATVFRQCRNCGPVKK